MVIKRIHFLLLSLVASILSYAQAPDGYYNAASGKSKADLKTALYEIIHSHTELTYSELWTAFYTTDARSNGKVWDIYSDIPDSVPSYYYTFGDNQCGSYSQEGVCYNREHSFPKSWFGDATPMYTDLFHIYPTDGYVNGKRSNYPYGEVGIASYTSSNGSKLGQCSFDGYTGTVFEPIDAYKGDLARTYFYMATCYEDKIADWVSNSEAQPMLAGNSYPAFNDWVINMLLKWSREDPVSEKEIDRNNAIYAIQGNRNPYIDHPELVEYIWGNKMDDTFVLDEPAVSLSPSGAVDFGTNVPGTTSYSTLSLTAYNITGDLTLSISGTNASKFTVSPTYISQDDALAGTSITISYLSTEVSTDSATLTISGGDITDETISLTGKSSNEFIALPATNVTSSSFTANWTASDNATGYTLNVYQPQATGTAQQVIFDYAFSDGMPTGWTTSGYTDLTTESGAIRMASGSNPGVVTTSAIGTDEETYLTVNAKQYSNDTGAKLYVSVGGVDVDTITTTSSYQDYTVTIPANNSTSTISLTAHSKARVFVSSATLETEGITSENVSIDGFPVTLGNVTAYAVSNLTADTTYYYTVTPIGGSDSKSSAIEVTTSAVSSINSEATTNISVYKAENGFFVQGISESATIAVYDTAGRLLKQLSSSAASLFVPFASKGVFFVSVNEGANKPSSFKLIF